MRTFKYRWSSAFGLSFLCHGIVLGAVAGLLFLFPPAQPSREPIEVDLVSDGGGGGGGGGGGQETEELPKIHEAKATPTAPPPAVPTEADEEAANDVHEVAQAQSTTSPSSAPAGESASSSSEGGSGGGTGGGQGTGSGKQKRQNGSEGGFLHHSRSPFANAALQRSFREKRRSGRAYKAIALTLLYPTQRAITTRTFVKY